MARAFAELERRIEDVRSPRTLVTTTDAVLTDQRLVDYRGPGGHRIQLPPADVAGVGHGAVVYVFNNGAGAITLVGSGRDTVAHLTSVPVAAGDAITVAAAGFGAWYSTTPAFPASPGQIFSPLWFSPVESALIIGGTSASSTDTVGPAIRTTKDMTCRGIRFGGDSRTVKVTLWQRNGGTRLETGHITVSTTGVYSFVFGTPRTVVAYTTYIATLWDETTPGTKKFTHTTTQEVSSGNGGFIQGNESDNSGSLIGPYVMHVSNCFSNGAGDAVPASTAGGRFPTELILDPVPLD